MRGVRSKRTHLVPRVASAASSTSGEANSGIFDRAIMCAGMRREHWKVALRRGSSQHGRAFRAVVAQKNVEAIVFCSPCRLMYVDR